MAASSAPQPAFAMRTRRLWDGATAGAVSLQGCARDPPPAPAGPGSLPLPLGMTQLFPLKQHQKGGYCSPASPRARGPR